jgi:hypothetical protein
MSAEIEFQRAINAALTGAGLRVYDFAPQVADGGSPATFPYVEIGHIIAGQWDTNTESGFDTVCRIHTFSRSGSTAECRGIQAQIYTILHKATLTVTGFQSIFLDREMSDCTRQADGSFHGVCEYRTLLETL